MPSSSSTNVFHSPTVLVAGTFDSKGRELRFIANLLRSQDLNVALVDLSTTEHQADDCIASELIAGYHPEGKSAVYIDDRGTAVAAMTQAFEVWIKQQKNIQGIIGAGGSGGTALLAPAMRALPFGIPKLLISTVASGEVSQYVGPADIMMLHSVADIQGLNAITREVLGNGANALAGMVKGRPKLPESSISTAASCQENLPAAGLTMFGVTTACVQQLLALLDKQYECFVFHATGIGGRSLEHLIDDGKITAVLDMTTTEVCDRLAGGIFPASDDRFGAIIRKRMPYIGSCGALDMVNFGPIESVPERYRGRLLYQHNAQVTLMRTTKEENTQAGQWIGERLNLMEGAVRFLLPKGGVSALDAPGNAFYDPDADQALFEALQSTVKQTDQRQLIQSAYHINDPRFAAEVMAQFSAIYRYHPSR